MQSGAVSLFVVIFATLLITVVTVSFLRLMVNDQSQASKNDLSQSAYDSAQAGVEDAKRALIRYQTVCANDGATACDQLATKINTASCNNALELSGVIPAGSSDATGQAGKTGEVRVQQSSSSGDQALDQAYTCVTIQLNTDDYVGSLSVNASSLVPLIGVSDFNTVKVEWFSPEDLGTSANSGSNQISLTGPLPSQPLLDQASWPINRPSILRTQMMQYGSDGFTLGSFDATTSSNQSNANTLFLYPTSSVTASSEAFATRDLRRTSVGGDTPIDQRGDTPLPVHCQSNLSAGGFACSETLTLPDLIGSGARKGFLRLTPLYNAAHFRVTLLNGSAPVQFSSVQPAIDSTGRANDIFRRVVSRVDLIDTSFPYPDGAVDLSSGTGSSGGFCKDFAVTDTSYISSNECTP